MLVLASVPINMATSVLSHSLYAATFVSTDSLIIHVPVRLKTIFLFFMGFRFIFVFLSFIFFSPPILLSFFLIQNHSSSLVVFYSLKSECIPFVSLQVYIFVALFLSIAKGLRFPFVCSRSIVWFARLALCNGI